MWLISHLKDRALRTRLAQRRNEETTGAAPRGAQLQFQAHAGHDVFARLPMVTSPTLVASGRFDGIAPPANGEAIADRIPAAEMRLYDGGHVFFQQDPAAVPDMIAFLED